LWKLKIFSPSVLLKKQFLSRFKLFNVELLRGQETEFFSRLFYKLNGSKFVIINKPLFYYRQHSLTKSKLNKKYIEGFKYSEAFNSIQNIKRGVELNDKDIINFHYKILINLYFLGLYNNHYTNASYILKNLLKILKNLNLVEFLKLGFFGKFFIITRRPIYRIEKELKKFIV